VPTHETPVHHPSELDITGTARLSGQVENEWSAITLTVSQVRRI